MIDYNVSQLELKLWRLYKESDPANVCEKCWEILFEMFPLSAAALWQRDSDATVYVVAHRGLSSQLSRLRLPKTDSAVGRAAMVKCRPLFVSDVQLSFSEYRNLTRLSPLELNGLREHGTRTVLFLPCRYADKDYVLMLCFSKVMMQAKIKTDTLSNFCEYFVDAFEQAQDNSRQRALVQLGKLLTPAAQVDRETMRGTMNKVAEIIRQTVDAGGVSIYLCSEDNKTLQLFGSSPGIEDEPSYEEVYYPLEHGQGLTPEVVLKNRIFRYPDLEAKEAEEELAARGYTRRKKWQEALERRSLKIYPFMAVPLRYQSDVLGVVRASSRARSECCFTTQEEEALRDMADQVAYFVSESQKAQARTTEAMQHIAHQFISPLNALQWHCYALQQGGFSEDRGRIVVNAISNLASLALIYGMNFELIARIWSGVRGDFDFRPLRIAPLLIELVRNYQPLAWKRRINIQVVDGSAEGSVDNLPNILGDRSALTQAFAAVIDNAIRYSAPGNDIIIKGVASLSEVHIYVTNVSSIPITAEWCERIFYRGERTPEAVSMEVVGTGTGLWLGRSILRLHGGELTVQPSERTNNGWKTSFIFSFKS